MLAAWPTALFVLLCLALLPVQPVRLDAHPMLAVSMLWLPGGGTRQAA